MPKSTGRASPCNMQTAFCGLFAKMLNRNAIWQTLFKSSPPPCLSYLSFVFFDLAEIHVHLANNPTSVSNTHMCRRLSRQRRGKKGVFQRGPAFGAMLLGGCWAKQFVAFVALFRNCFMAPAAEGRDPGQTFAIRKQARRGTNIERAATRRFNYIRKTAKSSWDKSVSCKKKNISQISKQLGNVLLLI